MQNTRNYTVHILRRIYIYIFYIDWVVRTGIRIELFMFVGVVLFFSHMLEHLMCNVFVCLVFTSKVN